MEAAAKVEQLVNFLLSLGLTFFVLLLCQFIHPTDRTLKIYALALTGILPVYYKSFVMIRGEPALAFWAVLSLYFSLRAFSDTPRVTDALLLGVGLGFSILSRQWGFFLFLAIALLVISRVVRHPDRLIPYSRQLILSVLVAFVIGGWFYIHLISTYGTATAFNRDPAKKFSLANQQRTFYIGTGAGRLFTDPVRPSFPNQLFPIFYSEMWGDYWMYFTIYGQNPASGNWVYGRQLEMVLSDKSLPGLLTDRRTFNSYLGRVNLISLLPTILLIGGFFTVLISTARRIPTPDITWTDEVNLLLVSLIVISFAGYVWFLILYPDFNRGNTIKATYLLHAFPVIALVAAQPLATLTRRRPWLFPATLIILGLVFLHNLPAMLTKYFV